LIFLNHRSPSKGIEPCTSCKTRAKKLTIYL
jgi:hypothetical protein